MKTLNKQQKLHKTRKLCSMYTNWFQRLGYWCVRSYQFGMIDNTFGPESFSVEASSGNGRICVEVGDSRVDIRMDRAYPLEDAIKYNKTSKVLLEHAKAGNKSVKIMIR